jgi:hypothetical protein
MATLKITDEQILENEVKEAIKKGKLYEYCTSQYDEEISKMFCEICNLKEICDAQRKKQK